MPLDSIVALTVQQDAVVTSNLFDGSSVSPAALALSWPMDVSTVDGLNWFAIEDGGLSHLLKYTLGAGWTDKGQVYGSGFWGCHSILALGPDRCLIVCDHAGPPAGYTDVIEYDGGVFLKHTVPSLSGAELTGITAMSGSATALVCTNGPIFGLGAEVYAWPGAGAVWALHSSIPMDIPSGEGVPEFDRHIYAADDSHIWAIAEQHAIHTQRIWFYDGSAWSVQHTFDPLIVNLSSIAGSGPTDVWATDWWPTGTIWHYDGATWTKSLERGANYRYFDIFALAGGGAAALGRREVDNVAVIEVYDGANWTQTVLGTSTIANQAAMDGLGALAALVFPIKLPACGLYIDQVREG